MQPVFVLVHSPSVGPLTWTPVADRLEARGQESIVPSLLDVADAAAPGGERRAASPAAGVLRADGARARGLGHAPLRLPALRAAVRRGGGRRPRQGMAGREATWSASARDRRARRRRRSAHKDGATPRSDTVVTTASSARRKVSRTVLNAEPDRRANYSSRKPIRLRAADECLRRAGATQRPHACHRWAVITRRRRPRRVAHGGPPSRGPVPTKQPPMRR